MQEFDIQLNMAHSGTAQYLRERGRRSNWSGYITEVCSGEYPGQSTVSLLPIIDLNPRDLSCIYSTLMFIIDQSKRINVKIPVITFDQTPLVKGDRVCKCEKH